ncbi:MAG: hypothetical protein PHN88_11675 [Ignavibacteria bacterium]|nr:hypothetical protein [Ignavibacteria bacterium]
MQGIVYPQQDPNYKQQKFKLTYTDTLIITGDKFVIQNTDVLIVDGKTLVRYIDYVINYRNGIISFAKDLFSRYSFDTLRIYDITVRYDLFPYTLKEEYSIFDVKIEKDTLTGDTIQIATQSTDLIENLFEGTDLQKSGSLFRGFTLGTNKDLSLNSGFKLQLNGKLTKDIEITAALTDENTPIQPEGNTQKLQELDKVFIELRSSNLAATIGDIDVSLQSSEFFNFKRKIQGAKGYGDFGFGNFMVTGAVSRGKFNTNNFNGSDGVQGPYRLTGLYNEINIVILSGTERVYVDGVQMTRGEQADYVIDYGLGQITFTNKRLITNSSRIVIDFEYSERKYSRTLMISSNGLKLFNKKLSVNVSYLNETDNEDRTIDFTLSDSDKAVLKNAGADKFKATRSGIVFAGRDSLNRPLGSYIKVDTLINNSNYSFYRFRPGSDSALYQVTFSYVGQGRGDYVSISTYQYNFAGIGQGSYAPIVFLPIPTSYQLAGVSFDYSANRNRDFYVKMESAVSIFNMNKFSITDVKKNGLALNGEAGYRKTNFKLLGINFDNVAVSYKERYIGKKFVTLDRINSAEFNRDFDLSDTTSAIENYRDGSLTIAPGKLTKIQGNFAQLLRGDFFNSTRFTGSFDFNNSASPGFNKNLPILRYSAENISSSNTNYSTNGSWFKQSAFLGFKRFFGEENKQKYIELSASMNNENRKSSLHTASADSLLAESFAFLEVIPKLVVNNILNLTLFTELNYRKDDAPYRGAITNLSNSFTQRYGLVYNGIGWFSADMDVAIRKRNYSEIIQSTDNQSNKSVLVNSRMRFSPLNSAVLADVLYSVTSERTAIVQKLFVLVPVGQGNYIYLGDVNHNGIQDENEFQLTNYDGNYIKLNIPTDQFFPTVDLKTSLRFTLKPSKYLYAKSNGIIADVYNNFSSETYIRIDEKSKDPVTDNIYFLRTSTFLNDSNTIAGTQMLQQDIFFFENNPMYSLRLRFLQSNSMNQYSSGNERNLNIQRSFRIRLGLTKDLTTQVELINKADRNIAAVNSIRNRNIYANNINTDLTYRPIQKIESGFQLNFSKADDFYPVVATRASINQEILRFIYSFVSSGRIRVELERDEVILNLPESNFPYELTNGRPSGKSYYWRASFDYSISKNIQASVNYDGRSEGSKQVIHTGRAQVTAFF